MINQLDSTVILKCNLQRMIILVISILIISSGNIFAQKTPTYSQFPTISKKKRATVINWSSHPKAIGYRTKLHIAFKKEPINFAGKFILTQWGCGTACIQAALIDTQTGDIFFPEILQGVTQGYNDAFSKHEMLEFKNSSNLLTIYGAVGNDFKDASKDYVQGIFYFEWTGKDFNLLQFIAK